MINNAASSGPAFFDRDKIISPGARVLVVGLGRSGLAALNFMQSKGVSVSVSDAAPLEMIDPDVRRRLLKNGVFIEAGGHSADLFVSVDCIVVSPGVALNLPELNAARRAGVPVIGEMGLAAQFLHTPLVAVTGTNGKSTVTTLLGEIFKQSGKRVFIGGNLGVPLTEYLAGPQNAEVVVAEVSSFQLDTAVDFRPDVAVLLNITPDHLDRYGSFDDYAASKLSILAALGSGGAAVLNADDPVIRTFMRARGRHEGGRTFYFGDNPPGDGAALHGKEVCLTITGPGHDDHACFDLEGSRLDEGPNPHNAMAAILAARLMGCSDVGIRQGIAGYQLLEHRMARVAEIDGVTFFDDSKATNVGAVCAALKSIRQPVILIAGGRDKGGDYAPLNELIKKKVRAMVLIGEAREKIAGIFGSLTRVELADELPAAVFLAGNIAVPGDAVLLSPACASFDMFAGYAQRGEEFRKAVGMIRKMRNR